MDTKYAFLFPGQGAQYVGMGKDFYDYYPVARSVFGEADELLSFSLSRLIFEGPESELILTKNAQVAIYVVSMAIWRTLLQECPDIIPTVCAGLSLGEYSALSATHRLSFQEGLELVRLRGQYMHEASVSHPGTMAAVLGLSAADLKEAILSSPQAKDVWIANLNCPGQVVISGTREGLERLSPLLKEKGAKRVISLEVSGAFHSGLMAEAQEKLKAKIGPLTLAPGKIGLVMNALGDLVAEEQKIKGFLIDQVVSPVYWEKGMHTMEEMGIDHFIEIGCGTTLQGMNRKIGIKAPTSSLSKIEDLELFLAKAER